MKLKKSTFIKLMALIIFILQNSTIAESNNSIQALCSHPQICNLLNMLPHHKKIETAVIISGDHHHFDPNPSDIKKLIMTKELFHGPQALHPWMKTIIKQRNLNKNVINYGLTLNPQFKNDFPKATDEALSHFWLYGKIACDMLKQYEQQLQLKSRENCLKNYLEIEEKLKEYFMKNKISVVLTHDALEPLFLSLGANVISLKGSNHHEEISPNAIKKLYNETKNQKLIWILETGFDIPGSVRNKIQIKDRVIKIDTMGSVNQKLTFVLENLLLQLQSTN